MQSLAWREIVKTCLIPRALICKTKCWHVDPSLNPERVLSRITTLRTHKLLASSGLPVEPCCTRPATERPKVPAKIHPPRDASSNHHRLFNRQPGTGHKPWLFLPQTIFIPGRLYPPRCPRSMCLNFPAFRPNAQPSFQAPRPPKYK